MKNLLARCCQTDFNISLSSLFLN